MVKVLRFFGYTLFFLISLIYLVPKVNFYYAAEHEGQKYKVVNSDEKLTDNGFSLSIQKSTIFYDSIEVANVEDIEIALLGIYNTVDVKNIQLSSFVASFVPLTIDEAHVKYSVLNPLNITGNSFGAFGKVHANVNLLDRKVSVALSPSALMLKKHRASLKQFKKNKEGVYVYEKTF